jgi:SAM-dependent methyltransferase
MNVLAGIAEIMQRHGATGTPEEFHSAVNVVFHEFESEKYDESHRDMWESVPQQIALLVQDCFPDPHPARGTLSVLDIGCGTGLASDALLKSPLGPSLRRIDLLDTSPSMLRRAVERAAGWGVPVAGFEGPAEMLLGKYRYDLILTCSVLHHVPDVAAFLRTVRGLQADGGAYIHLQDPNGDYLDDPELRQRTAAASRRLLPEWLRRLAPRRILGRIRRELTGQQGEDYLGKTNRELLRRGVIATPLSVAEIFAITDIHAQDGSGISIERMKQWLPDYRLVSQRSYGFFGQLGSTLPPRLQITEQDLITRRALNGFHVGAAWRLTGR